MQDAKLYYEAHVTIEPVFEERLEEAKSIANANGFRVANLLFKKREDDTPERSMHDTFMTGHSKVFEELKDRMISLILDLKANGFKVWRYKIEDTVLDSRTTDVFSLI